MKFTLFTLFTLIFLLLSTATSASYDTSLNPGYGYDNFGYPALGYSTSYGAESSGPSYQGRTTIQYQQNTLSFGSRPYAPYYNYLRYQDKWAPFDFKLSRTINHDLIEQLIKSFDGEDIDLLYALANLNQYDAVDQKYILDGYLKHNDFDCLSLDAYNTLADLDAYDQYDPVNLNNLDADNLDAEFLRRFDFTDYQRIANADSSDRIKPITSSSAKDLDYEDFDCFDLRDYNAVASLNPSDKWDVIDFTDYDDLDHLDDIGRKRVVFFHPGDFDEFDLFNPVNPNAYYLEPYLYGPFDIPTGNYSYRRGNRTSCTNTYSSFCSNYYDSSYLAQGSFNYYTDITFDNQRRSRSNSAYGANGARRPSARETVASLPGRAERTSMARYQYDYDVLLPSQKSTKSTATQSQTEKAVVEYQQNEMNITPFSQPVPLAQSNTQQTSQEDTSLLWLLFAILIVLLIVIFLLTRR